EWVTTLLRVLANLARMSALVFWSLGTEDSELQI
ncbi:hypothetical protein A2U01_0052478, partial [Trifolium medium]|nr:hypothetical protein [Trifolium medium]